MLLYQRRNLDSYLKSGELVTPVPFPGALRRIGRLQ
jgi:hypothetical protein